ncbi:LOB domain-containing protein 31-like [Papaver somniferum]|uniref:LOB domain-containing protein 31-like n=1 Tax=Papaver somniferum TaxID=3469 RepID=UPI000E6FAD1E|nr:LOB domain-containing protein 31-like [Papaver somniferum]
MFRRVSYIQLFSTYFDVPRFQIGYAASTADRQKIEARITDSTRTFEVNAGVNEPLFGAIGVLLALHQLMGEEVNRFETITGEGVNVTPAGTMNHFVLKDSEKIEQQHRACPSCTYLPQKCKVDCPFVRFFEACVSRDFIREFYTVLCGSTAVLPDHSNLQSADEWNKAGITAEALEFENKARVHDPVYGTTGIILSLYKNWWNLNHHVRLLEQRDRSVQNFPTVQIGSCNIPTDKGKGIVTPESTNECSTIAEWMDMEDDDESLYSREEVLKNYMEFQQEVALIQPLPQE